MAAGLFNALFSGMWHGYRRWMTLFNTVSIVLSVMLAMVVMGFAFGVRAYVDEVVRKEAAAGAVRVHAAGWQPQEVEANFQARVRTTDADLRSRFGEAYRGFNFWWRSEAHYLMPGHPAENGQGGIFTKLGNTYQADPEAARVRPFAVAGRWVADPEAPEIVLSMPAAVKLLRRVPDAEAAGDLLGRRIWISLPGTEDHLPAACALVEVVGVFDHLRDGACMTTPRVVQDIHARTQMNAYGKWFETYDRLAWRVAGVEGLPSDGAGVPLVCWRTRDAAARWLHPRGAFAARGETEETRALRADAQSAAADLDNVLGRLGVVAQELDEAQVRLSGADETRAWLGELEADGLAVFGEPGVEDRAAGAEAVRDRLGEAAQVLGLAPDPEPVTNRETFAARFAAVTNAAAAVEMELRGQVTALQEEAEALGVRREALTAHVAARTAEADRIAASPPIPDGAPLRAFVSPDGLDTNLVVEADYLAALPASAYSDLEALDVAHPEGYLLCSPRVWDELGYGVAPLYDVGDWREQALYAYLYFDGLRTAIAARGQLEEAGFATYMPIDRFRGMLALARVVTWAAAALLAAVLFSGLLGIVVTLYTEVDAEGAEIGLMKALGASNRVVGLVYLSKGAFIGLVGVAAGLPLAWLLSNRINGFVSGVVARAAGLADTEAGLFRTTPAMAVGAAALVVLLASLAALLPALQAAARDPQEALYGNDE